MERPRNIALCLAQILALKREYITLNSRSSSSGEMNQRRRETTTVTTKKEQTCKYLADHGVTSIIIPDQVIQGYRIILDDREAGVS